MNCKNSQFKQRGVFSVEFALIAVFFSMLLVFSGDVIIKLSTKGKLDRLSYSLVSIIKERNKLYGNNSSITSTEVDDLFTFAKGSLERTMANFDNSKLKILVEEQAFIKVTSPSNGSVTFDKDNLLSFPSSGGCSVGETLNNLNNLEDLAVVSAWGNKMALYRVTLCYETDNWFGNLSGGDYKTVSSSSVIIGR